MKAGLIFSFILILIVSGCVSSSSNTIKIGGAFALTGAAAEWGNEELQVAELAIGEANIQGGINGKNIELIIEDTKTENAATLNAIQKLITVDKVQVIIGPSWGDSFGAIVGPVGEQNKVVQITPSGAIEVAEDLTDFPYFFSTWYPQQPEIERHVQYLKAHNYTRVVVVRDQDPFNVKFTQLYTNEAARGGINVTKTFEMPLGTKDFRSVIALAKEENPDVILMQIFEIGELGLAIKNMKELGMNAKLMASASAQTNNLVESYGEYVEDTMIYTYPDVDSESMKSFFAKFKAKYGKEPATASAPGAYDATNAVIAALRSGATTGGEIKDAFYAMKIPGTIVAELSFNTKGAISTAPFVIKTVRNGTFVVVE